MSEDRDDAEWITPDWEKMLKDKYESDLDFLEELLKSDDIDQHAGDGIVAMIGYLMRDDVKDMLLTTVCAGTPTLGDSLVDVLKWALGVEYHTGQHLTSVKVVPVQECRFCGHE